jgi:hypothetical protein
MGLDAWVYVAPRPDYKREYEATVSWDPDLKKLVNPNMSRPREIAYWRNHSNLHQWMMRLYLEKGGTGDFNDDELELFWDDIKRLESDLKEGKLRDNWRSGLAFGMNFGAFGSPQDDKYSEYDVEFCINAKAELFLGLRIFYNSSW